jgi:uncharacterized protein
MTIAINVINNTEDEIEDFEAVCRRLGGFDARISAEWLDGYLCALAAGPRTRDIDDWLPRATRGVFARAFADPDDEVYALVALLARWRVVRGYLNPEALIDDPDTVRLQPLVMLWDDEARQALIDEQGVPAEEAAQMTTGAVWALGFLEAVKTDSDWKQPADAAEGDAATLTELLQQVSVLTLSDADEAYRDHLRQYWKDRSPTRDDLLGGACFAVQDLRLWWLDHAPRPATRRVEPKPGRNDPCPCGSGLKYKKCHGKG